MPRDYHVFWEVEWLETERGIVYDVVRRGTPEICRTQCPNAEAAEVTAAALNRYAR